MWPRSDYWRSRSRYRSHPAAQYRCITWFVRVTPFTVVLVPITTFPYASVVAEVVIASVAVPVSGTVTGLSPETTIEPVRTPPALGTNVTVIVQLLLGPRPKPGLQVLVKPKSPAIVTLEI